MNLELRLLNFPFYIVRKKVKSTAFQHCIPQVFKFLLLNFLPSGGEFNSHKKCNGYRCNIGPHTYARTHTRTEESTALKDSSRVYLLGGQVPSSKTTNIYYKNLSGNASFSSFLLLTTLPVHGTTFFQF